MIQNMFLEVIPDLLPVIIIITVIACSLRISYLIKYKHKFVLHKEIFNLIFILYIMCLFEVVTFQDINFGTSNFIPFKEIFRYNIGSRLFVKNIIGNVLLFLPYGYFVSYYLKNKKILPTTLLTIMVSTTIEIVQLKIGRTFDIDDIILNTTGGIIGCSIYILIEKIKSLLPAFFQNDTVINALVIILIITIIMYSFNLNIFNQIEFIVR
jgi:glycopeptide antibiotics resistance protein